MIAGLGLASFAWAAPARAQDEADTPRPELAEPPRDQLDADIEPLPAGYGAIFVPALESDHEGDDVSVVVQFEGETLAVGRVGQRIPVPPGHYRVLVGSGPATSRASSEIDVVRDVTSTLPSSFGIVRISLVDEHGKAVDEPYSVGSVDTGAKFGPFRPDMKAGTRPSKALFLAPGRYSFALGSNPSARQDATVLMVAAGQVLQYRVVVEDGHLVRTEFGESEVLETPSPWKLRWTVAADGSFSSRRNQLSSYNGDVLTLGAYTKFELALDTGRHLAELNLLADESAVGIVAHGNGSEFPLQKLTDDVRAELVYNYRLGGIVGPYARAVGYTSLFPTKYYAGQTTQAVTTDEAGNVLRNETFEAGSKHRMFPEFGPLVLQQGLGLGTRIDTEHFRFGLRGGAATREAFFFDGRYAASTTGGETRFTQLADVTTFGAEATATVGFRIRNLLELESRLDAFLGEDQFDTFKSGGSNYRPIYRWDNTATVKLSRYISLVYLLGLRRDSQAIAADQITHSLRLRFQWAIF